MIECQTEDLDDLKNYQVYLSIFASCVLLFSFVGILIASFAADNSINYLWEHLRRKVQVRYEDLTNVIVSRVSDYHEDWNALPNILDPSQCQKSTSFHFRHSLRYFIDFLPLLIVAGGVYSLLILVEFQTIHVLLDKKPNLIQSIYDSRFSISKIYFLTTELTLSGTNYTLVDMYKGSTPIADIKSADILLTASLHSIKQLFYDPDIRLLLSNQDISYLFDSYQSSSVYLSTGILAAMDSFVMESLFIVNSDQNQWAEGPAYLDFALQLSQALTNLSSSAYASSSSYIQGLLINFLIYVGAFCVLHIIGYVSYYAPYLKKEERVLINLEKLMGWIPSNKQRKKFGFAVIKCPSEERSLEKISLLE